MNTLRRLLGLGCAHKRITWPQGKKDKTVTCMDCLKTLKYDWENMRVVK